MNLGFWLGILIFVLVVVALAWAAGSMINKQGRSRHRPNPRDPVTGLKASGALRHRKSNRD